MQQGGSNHHHELFISRQRRSQQHKTHRGPFFILYWKRIHLHSREIFGTQSAGHQIFSPLDATWHQICTKKESAARRGLNVRIWIQFADSLHLHIHEFCKRSENP